MLDSPYVRRVAIALQLLEIPFEHESLSVFRTFEAFRAINPVVKAPTLVADDGTVLVESTLIIEYAQSLAAPRSLRPREAAARLADLRLTGLALTACDRGVHVIYEELVRPPEKRHAPWIERVTGQLLAACEALESGCPDAAAIDAPTDGAMTTAVAWHFLQRMIPGVVPAARFPRLQALSAAAEDTPEFRNAPHDGAQCSPRVGQRRAGA